MDRIFQSQDPNYIANILQIELNTIFDILAPSKIVQLKNNHIPYYDNKIRAKVKECDKLLTSAIKSNKIEDWIIGRNKPYQR